MTSYFVPIVNMTVLTKGLSRDNLNAHFSKVATDNTYGDVAMIKSCSLLM